MEVQTQSCASNIQLLVHKDDVSIVDFCQKIELLLKIQLTGNHFPLNREKTNENISALHCQRGEIS